MDQVLGDSGSAVRAGQAHGNLAGPDATAGPRLSARSAGPVGGPRNTSLRTQAPASPAPQQAVGRGRQSPAALRPAAGAGQGHSAKSSRAAAPAFTAGTKAGLLSVAAPARVALTVTVAAVAAVGAASVSPLLAALPSLAFPSVGPAIDGRGGDSQAAPAPSRAPARPAGSFYSEPLALAGGRWPGLSLQAATKLTVPILFGAAVALFVLIQAFIDRRDPKLARAPERGEDDTVGFG